MITITKNKIDRNWYKNFRFSATEPIDSIPTEATNLSFVHEAWVDGVYLEAKRS